MSQETTSVFDPSPDEKLQLVEDLWDDLASTPDLVPIHDWRKDELDRRRANPMAASGAASSWEKMVWKIRGRHGR